MSHHVLGHSSLEWINVRLAHLSRPLASSQMPLIVDQHLVTLEPTAATLLLEVFEMLFHSTPVTSHQVVIRRNCIKTDAVIQEV